MLEVAYHRCDVLRELPITTGHIARCRFDLNAWLDAAMGGHAPAEREPGSTISLRFTKEAIA